MGYSDQKYYSNDKVCVPNSGTATMSALASAAVGTLAGLSGMYFIAPRAMNLKSARVTCFAAPVNTYSPLTIVVMNGTTTMASGAITTATVNQGITVAVSAANEALASGDKVTFNAIGTATASNAGASTGGFTAFLEFNDQFS